MVCRRSLHELVTPQKLRGGWHARGWVAAPARQSVCFRLLGRFLRPIYVTCEAKILSRQNRALRAVFLDYVVADVLRRAAVHLIRNRSAGGKLLGEDRGIDAVIDLVAGHPKLEPLRTDVVATPLRGDPTVRFVLFVVDRPQAGV